MVEKCPVCGLYHSPHCSDEKINKNEKIRDNKDNKFRFLTIGYSTGWKTGEISENVWKVITVRSPEGNEIQLWIMSEGRETAGMSPDSVFVNGGLDWEGNLENRKDWLKFKKRYPRLSDFLIKEKMLHYHE